MSPTIHWPVSHPPTAIVTARKMTAATRPAANATISSAVTRIIAGIAATATNGARTGSRRWARIRGGPFAMDDGLCAHWRLVPEARQQDQRLSEPRQTQRKAGRRFHHRGRRPPEQVQGGRRTEE